MLYTLYQLSTSEILKRNQFLASPEVINLDSDLVYLEEVEIKPQFNTNTEVLVYDRDTIDLATKTIAKTWTVIPLPPPIPQPDWDVFNSTVFANERFNQVFSQAINIRPLLAVSLPTAMDQVTTKGLTLFASLYGAVCALGGATAEDKLEWGQLARNANLPPEFIDIVEN